MTTATVWHTAKTAAKHATVSEWTIRQAVKDGDLPAYPVGKSGRGYRLKEREVDDWMSSRAYEPGGQSA